MTPALPRSTSRFLLLVPLLLAACSDAGIGRKCVNPTDAGVSGTQLSSPSLECPSRLCLLREGQNSMPAHTICTDFCQTDSDCSTGILGSQDPKMATPGLCNQAFVCAVAVVSGPFCCRKMCICTTDLEKGVNIDPASNTVKTPDACKPGQTHCANVM